jgi:predicted secreted acid phosphatase
MNKLLVVIDIDNTVSDGRSRTQLVGPAPKLEDKAAYLSWVSAINENMQHDEPVRGMRDFCRALSYGGAHCVFLTNREEEHREATEKWLYNHGFPAFKVFMRETGSYSEATEYKGEVIHNLIEVFGFDDVMVIDDDGSMKALCDRKGYTFLKAGQNE